MLDIKGAKRFKSGPGAKAVTSSRAETLSLGPEEKFRKLTQTTSYSQSFGEPPKATEDFAILKKRKFSSLPLSQYVSASAKQYIEKWISLRNPDEFLKRIYFVMREIHTVIKNQEAPINNHTIWFNRKQADKPQRFDQRYLQLREARQHKRAQSSQLNYRPRGATQRFNENLPLKTFAPLINTKEFKQAFLRGQAYDITEMFDP